jgi:hypothetical protein
LEFLSQARILPSLAEFAAKPLLKAREAASRYQAAPSALLSPFRTQNQPALEAPSVPVVLEHQHQLAFLQSMEVGGEQIHQESSSTLT